MDQLPLDVHLEISSYLSLNEIANCRLVSHSFKMWAEARMQHITHLKLRINFVRLPTNGVKYEWDGTIEKEMEESYVRHTFFFKPCVTALVHIGCSYGPDSTFYAFLGKLCPNLQVLDLYHFDINKENLTLLASELQFLICGSVLSRMRSLRIVPSSLDQFPNLKGFACRNESCSKYINPLNKRLLQLNRPVCELRSKKALDEETVKLLARGGIKRLHLRMESGPAFSLSQSLAESLVDLSVDFVPYLTFCPFTLPNLLYLTIRYEKEWSETDSTALVSAPNLRCFTWEGATTFHRLMNFINSFNKLRVFHVTNKHHIFGDHEKVKISLPASLEKLTFTTFTPLELVEHSSTSLKYLVVDGIISSSFVCPNLKLLICRKIELDPATLSRLVHSISHCDKLARVSLIFMQIHKSVSLQPLIDLLSSMTGLTHLKLATVHSHRFYHSVYFVENVFSPDSIYFDQQKFPSLVSLHLKLPKTKIVFHLTDSFVSFKLSRFKGSSSLELEVWDKVYSVYGYGIEVVCSEQLDNLVEVTLDQSPDRTELSLVRSEDTSQIHDSHCFPLDGGKAKTGSFSTWLFGLISSHANSGATEAGGGDNQEAALDIILPPHLEQLDLHLVSSLNSLRLSSPALRCLSISHVRQLRLDLPSLREIQLQNWFEPLDATLATQLGALTSMTFRFVGEKEASVAVMESHLKTASEFKQLTTLKFENLLDLYG